MCKVHVSDIIYDFFLQNCMSSSFTPWIGKSIAALFITCFGYIDAVLAAMFFDLKIPPHLPTFFAEKALVEVGCCSQS